MLDSATAEWPNIANTAPDRQSCSSVALTNITPEEAKFMTPLAGALANFSNSGSISTGGSTNAGTSSS